MFQSVVVRMLKHLDMALV